MWTILAVVIINSFIGIASDIIYHKFFALPIIKKKYALTSGIVIAASTGILWTLVCVTEYLQTQEGLNN